MSNKSIEISQEDVKPLIEFFDSKRAQKAAELEIKVGEVQVLQSEVKYYERKIQELRGEELIIHSHEYYGGGEPVEVDNKPKNIYNTQWGWVQKIKYAIETAKHPLTTSEIMDILQAYEPEIKEKARSVSAILSDRIKERIDFMKVVDPNSSYPKYTLINPLINPLINSPLPPPISTYGGGSFIKSTHIAVLDPQNKPKRHYTPRGSKGNAVNLKGYNKAWSLAQKAAFAIKEVGHVITTREMVQVIAKHEPHIMLENGWTFGRFQRNLGSSLLQKYRKNKVFGRIQSDGIDFLWGLNDWFISDGEVREQYKAVNTTTNKQSTDLVTTLFTNGTLNKLKGG